MFKSIMLPFSEPPHQLLRKILTNSFLLLNIIHTLHIHYAHAVGNLNQDTENMRK